MTNTNNLNSIEFNKYINNHKNALIGKTVKRNGIEYKIERFYEDRIVLSKAKLIRPNERVNLNIQVEDFAISWQKELREVLEG